MAVECALITGILLTMAVFFFARKHKSVGWATLPLTLVPLAQWSAFFYIANRTDSRKFRTIGNIVLAADMTALMAAIISLMVEDNYFLGNYCVGIRCYGFLRMDWHCGKRI